ncbi:GPR endopeptidase [Eubacteriales bacterium OttesenSCG-928-M02]|nr:GPR endopeptidase [Eubacteriales bacterium OttesenSCG-928-M02]
MHFFRTDMAVESPAVVRRSQKGIKVEERREENDIKITIVDITDEAGEQAVGKPMGRYVTIENQDIALGEPHTIHTAAQVFAKELSLLLGEKNNDDPYLVVGIGNRAVTADSIGPLTAENIIVTRHLFGAMEEYLPARARSACAIAPGVLGETGMETGEVIKSIVDAINPNCIIAIDSLAAQSPQRVAASIQLSNTGIAPGSGLGNNRPRLDEGYLGVPVIAIGVPMVVYASAIAYQAASAAMADDAIPQSIQERLMGLLDTDCGDMVVTPKDVDSIAENCAFLLSTGINMAIHHMDFQEATNFA